MPVCDRCGRILPEPGESDEECNERAHRQWEFDGMTGVDTEDGEHGDCICDACIDEMVTESIENARPIDELWAELDDAITAKMWDNEQPNAQPSEEDWEDAKK